MNLEESEPFWNIHEAVQKNVTMSEVSFIKILG